MSLLNQINLSKTPEHIAIIMDGNGRWAKQQGEMRLFGHLSGVEAVREVLKGCVELGVRHLTLYAFSTENWNRPKEEVDGLMNLMVETISNEVEELHKNGVRLFSIGDEEQLPQACRNALQAGKDATANNTKVNLILALNYSSRWELIEATKSIAKKVKSNELEIADINDEVIHQHLCSKDFPNPELMIRTSGEYRLSNFLLWQLAYTELYFTDVLWPDFTKEDLYKAVLDYQSRERRFGMVSEQLT
jgi:undecaprenyl diphosphate synthase